MLFATAYILAAVAGVAILILALKRLPKTARPGMEYLLAALLCSSALLFGQILAFLAFGAWFIAPVATIGIGFAIPGAMRLMV